MKDELTDVMIRLRLRCLLAAGLGSTFMLACIIAYVMHSHNENDVTPRPQQRTDAGRLQQPQALVSHDAKSVDVRRPVKQTTSGDDYVHIAIACCLAGTNSDGQQLILTQTFLKSLLTFNPASMHLHVFLSANHSQPVIDMINAFLSIPSVNFLVNYYNATMPDVSVVVRDGRIKVKTVKLSALFKPCSAQRLFLPYALPQLDRVLYMDTDTIVLGDVGKIWQDFARFSSVQLYGMSFIAKHRGFYDRRPYYQPYKGLTGHNAGVMLMHLQRMRDINWQNLTLQIIANLSGSNWAYASDQDVLNYYNGLHEDHVFEMSCAHNWRWSLCRKYENQSQECLDAARDGITVIHGVSGTFFKSNVFVSKIYRIFSKFKMGESIYDGLVLPIQAAIDQHGSLTCGNVGDAFLKQIMKYV